MLALTWAGFEWTVNRVYVDQGQSLMLRYKGPLLFGSATTAVPGYFAEEGEIGVLKNLRGPGRHFYCPIWYERQIVPDTIIKPGQIGIVTCKLGQELPAGEFLVDGDMGTTLAKGILRKVLHPGKYRIHPYAYTVDVVAMEETKNSQGQVKHYGWVEIPTGYVGVVTNLTDNPLLKQKAGIQHKVLPPGNYPINGKEQQVDIVEVGYRVANVCVLKEKNADGTIMVDKNGEPQFKDTNTGINFPSNDGFPIYLDFTAIWGLMPDQAADAISKFGDVNAVENKIVLPQIESICRNNGSEYSAVQLLVGQERQHFQTDTLENFRKVLEGKNITFQTGLVRHIYIPKQVREPIQTGFISKELKLTRDQEQTTAKEEANLREAEKKVELEAERVRSETKKLVAERLAEGRKKVGETVAETTKLVAAIKKQTAILDAQAVLVRGEAEAGGSRMVAEAKSQKFKLAVDAFGSADAYNNWIFATGLPAEVELKLLYAGEGTLWTDMKSLSIIKSDQKRD